MFLNANAVLAAGLRATLDFLFSGSTTLNPKEQKLLGRYFSCNDYTDLLFAVLVLSTGVNDSGVVEVGFSARLGLSLCWPGLGQDARSAVNSSLAHIKKNAAFICNAEHADPGYPA
jgi:hypothetical protein